MNAVVTRASWTSPDRRKRHHWIVDAPSGYILKGCLDHTFVTHAKHEALSMADEGVEKCQEVECSTCADRIAEDMVLPPVA